MTMFDCIIEKPLRFAIAPLAPYEWNRCADDVVALLYDYILAVGIEKGAGSDWTQSAHLPMAEKRRPGIGEACFEFFYCLFCFE